MLGRIFESYFDLPKHYLNIIVVTDTEFILEVLTEGTCAIAITADLSFKLASTADFTSETRYRRDDIAAPCCTTDNEKKLRYFW